MTYRPPHRVMTFDEVLGPSQGRYLAHGHQSVDRSVQHLAIEHGEGQVVGTATGRASYPPAWSSKAGGSLVPHLSSIDAIVFAEHVVGAAFAPRAGRSDGCSIQVVDVDIRAGSRPHLDLEHIPIRCVANLPEPAGVLTAVCTVGTLRVRLLAMTTHPPARSTGSTTPESPRLLRRPESIGRSGATWSSTFEEVLPDATSLVASHTPEQSGSASDRAELSAVDLLSLSAQQAQILIYNAGGVTRDETDTLWMRKARFLTPPDAAQAAPLTLRLDISEAVTLRRGGDPWHLFDMRAEASTGASATASLAYRARREEH